MDGMTWVRLLSPTTVSHDPTLPLTTVGRTDVFDFFWIFLNRRTGTLDVQNAAPTPKMLSTLLPLPWAQDVPRF